MQLQRDGRRALKMMASQVGTLHLVAVWAKDYFLMRWLFIREGQCIHTSVLVAMLELYRLQDHGGDSYYEYKRRSFAFLSYTFLLSSC